MKEKQSQNIKISHRLERVLKQLEQVTNAQNENAETPAHGGEDGREEKEFPRTLGNA